MADLAQAQRVPGLPAPVQEAIDQVLALRAPLDSPPTAADIKAALTGSGLVSPAQPAAAPAAAGATQAATAPLSAGAIQAAAALIPSSGTIKGALLDLQQVLKTWLDNVPAQPVSLPASTAASPAATSRQDGLASSPADLSPALRASDPPAPVQPAIVQPVPPAPLASVPTTADTSSASVQPSQSAETALAAAALPPEASPATASLLPSGTNPTPALPVAEQVAPPPLDGALTAPPSPPTALAPLTPPTEEMPPIPSARGDLDAASPAPQQVDPAPAEPVADQAATALAVLTAQTQSISILPTGTDLMQALQIFQQVFKSWFYGAPATSPSAPPADVPTAKPLSVAAPSSAAPGAAPNNSPPPPYRGGPTTAQPPVPSTLLMNTDPITVGNQLTRETNAALAHQELLGIASLPTATPSLAHSNSQVSQWMFEMPFATPQGTAVAQFKISRDGTKGGKGRQASVWRANFSLDVEPMGPVHAQITLSGERTWVSLWAEREASAAQLRGHQPLLTKALRDSDFVAEIAIHVGVPHQPAPLNGQFLDRQS